MVVKVFIRSGCGFHDVAIADGVFPAGVYTKTHLLKGPAS